MCGCRLNLEAVTGVVLVFRAGSAESASLDGNTGRDPVTSRVTGVKKSAGFTSITAFTHKQRTQPACKGPRSCL